MRQALVSASALLLVTAPLGAQGLRLHSLFSHHAVLPCDVPLAVHGTAAPGAEVEVAFGDLTAHARAGDDGVWLATLPAQPPSAVPRELVVRSGSAAVLAGDLLVGEVWVCSGQSNMAWRVRQCSTPEAFAAAADVPALRMFTAPNQEAATPQRDLRGSWRVCTPAEVLDFSACAYHFGRALHDALDVPVGLVHVSWGGSTIEAWLPRDRLAALPCAAGLLADHAEYHPAATAPPETWAAAGVDDRRWPTVHLPATFAALGHADLDGVLWFRTVVTIPPHWQGRELRLSLGAIDDRDVTCFGGERIGGGNRRTGPRVYTVPARLVVPGPAVVAVAVTDDGGRGGFAGTDEELHLAPADAPAERIPLAGRWRLHVASRRAVPAPQHWPAHLFHALIHPLRHLAPRGVIWYQGESNSRGARAADYAALFPELIAAWRELFAAPDLPFLFVQLPVFGPDGAETDWQLPLVREAQLATLRAVPRTGMAITLDLGDPKDIHPSNKHDVGGRLARWALADVYGRSVAVKSGPIAAAAGFAAEDGAVAVAFDLFGGGLATRDGAAPAGFELAGEDGVFRAADAAILGDGRVEVRCAAVPRPHAVRYAWRNSPLDANLVGGEGLPASPFRFARSP